MPARVIEVKITAQNSAAPQLKGFKDLLGSIADVAVAPTRAIGGLIDVAGKIGLAAIGVGALVGGLVDLGKSFASPIAAASDLNESINKAQVVFGQSSAAIMAFGSTSAQSLGISKQAAIEAAGTFGNLFTSMGLGQKQSADLSTKIVTLGADLASFNNIKPEEALEKLRAGLVGEAEPLRTLGVNLTEAGVKLEGMRLKLPMLGGELTEASKIQARYSLIVQQTKNAQGDFANTSDGMANAMRIINASFQDAQATIGEKFLPVVAPLVAAFSRTIPGAIDLVMPLIDRLAGAFKNVIQFGQEIAVMARNISGEYGLGMIPAVLTTLEIKIRETLGPRAASIFHNLIDAAKDVPGIFDRMAKALGPLASAMGAWVGDGLEVAARLLPPLAAKINSSIAFIVDHMDAVAGLARAYIILAGAQAMGAIPGAVNAIIGSLGKLNPLLIVGAIGVTAWAVAYETHFGKVREQTDFLISVIQGFPGAVKDAFLDNTADIHQWWIFTSHDFGLFTDAMGKMLTDVNEWRVGIGKAVDEAITGIGASFTQWLADLDRQGAEFKNAGIKIGQDIWSGLVTGITSGGGQVVKAAFDLGASAIAAIRQAVDAHSDSEEAVGIGEDITSGLATGITDSASTVTSAIEQLGTAIGASFSTARNLIEKENEDFAERMETSDLKYGRRHADLEKQLGRAKVTERKGILEQIANLERDHGRQVEDLAQQHADNLVDAEQRMARERGTALQDFARDVQRAERETGEALDQLNDRTGDAMASAIKDATRGIDEATRNATESIQRSIDDLASSRVLRGIRDAFGAGQDFESRARSRNLEDQDLARQLPRSIGEENDNYAKATEALTRKRLQEDADRQYELAKDLGKAKTDDEKAEVRDRFREASADLTRRRQLEDKERVFQKGERLAEIQQRHTEQVSELAARRARETADEQFRQGQERERVAFSDGLEDDALTKSIVRTNTDRDNRIKAIQDALADKVRQLEDDDAGERRKINASHVQKIADLKEKFLDKVGPLLGEAQTAITTFLDAVDTRTALVTAGILTKTTQAATALAGLGGGGLGAGLVPNGPGNAAWDGRTDGMGNTYSAAIGWYASGDSSPSTSGSDGSSAYADNYYQTGTQLSPGESMLNFATGGRVPGMPGEPQLAIVHGGETISPGGPADDTPVIIMLDGNAIMRSTWRRLKQQNLIGTNIGVT